jgi:hypothetical protein
MDQQGLLLQQAQQPPQQQQQQQQHMPYATPVHDSALGGLREQSQYQQAPGYY